MLSRPGQFDNSTFCVLPFYGIEYPKNTACCLLPNGADIHSIKKSMLANQRPTDCAKCWAAEDVGIVSDRLIKNQTFDYFLRRNIQDLYNECQHGQEKILHYKLDTSNVCNATCVTCGSGSSTAWAKLHQQHGIAVTPVKTITDTGVDTMIDYASAKMIIFRGGEPFLSRTNFYVLEQLIAHGNTTCFLSFVTNGSFNLNQRQWDLLSKFANVNFCFSIDGVGPVFEYLRYPLTFEKIESNLSLVRQKQFDISVSYTVSNLNILYHQQTVEWFEKNNLKYIVNPVYTPEYFAASVLPSAVKQHIKSELDYRVIDLCLPDKPTDPENYQKFLKEIQDQDRMKGIKLSDYLPALAHLLDIE